MSIEWDDAPGVEWDDAPKREPAFTARKGGEMALAGMSPAEQALAAFGGGMYRTGRNAGNLLGNVAEKISGHRLGMPTDEQLREDAPYDAPLAENNKIATFAGELAPQIPLMMATGGGATVARAGVGSRLANVARQAAGGAAQGYVFSGPDDRETNAAIGGVLGGGVAAVANPLAALARNALGRANKAAVDLFEPSIEKLREIGEKWRGHGTMEQGFRNAGQAIREAVDPQTGRRLIAPVEEIGERALMAERIGNQGGKEINQVLRRSDAMGLKGKPAEIHRQLVEARQAILGEGPYDTFSPSQRKALAVINRQIDDFERIFGTKAKPGAVNPGVIPEETRPLELATARDPVTGKPTQTSPVVGESLVGASAPDTVRVFDPPYITGRVTKVDPVTKKFVKGGQVPAQPDLIPSRDVEIATEAWSPWRSFVNKQANRDRLIPGTNRPRPLRRNEYMPQEVTREAEHGVGSPFQQVTFEDLPLSKFEEKAKRLFGKEGYEQAGSGRYRTQEAADANPAVQWYRRATGITKGHVEDSLERGLGRDEMLDFVAGKKKAQLAEVFGPAADAAAVIKGARTTGTGGSPQGWFFRRAVDTAKRHSRPYRIVANEKLDAMADFLPHNTDAALRAALIEMLRQEEK